jgi:hypothetical protein
MRCASSPRKSAGLSVVGALLETVSQTSGDPKHHRPVQGGQNATSYGLTYPFEVRNLLLVR